MEVNGKVDGKLMNVVVNGAQLQCETNCDFSYSIEMIPATSPNGGNFKGYVTGYQTWSISVDGKLLLRSLGADFKTLVETAKRGERVFIRMGTLDGVELPYAIEGYAYVQNIALGAPSTDQTTWNVQFQGDGEFTTDWNEFAMIIDNNPAETAWDLVYNAN